MILLPPSVVVVGNTTLKFFIVLPAIKLQPLTVLALVIFVVAADRPVIQLAGSLFVELINGWNEDVLISSCIDRVSDAQVILMIPLE